MHIGVNYPQDELETDPAVVKRFVAAVEDMGFSHIVTAEHVVGANPATRPGVNLPYSLDSTFLEPFCLYSFVAAASETLGLVTGVMVLPQRQTVLVAKQAACLDVLSAGRLRLGVGIGWNDWEYVALGTPYLHRGKRIEEQVEVLRALWTQDAVTFHGECHLVPDVGIKPLPVQRPIPVWFGGGTDRPMFNQLANESVMRRIARLGDGWIPQLSANDRGLELIVRMRSMVAECGRDVSKFGVEGRIDAMRATAEDWSRQARFWRDAEISHLYVNTSRDGLYGVDEHLRRLEEFRVAVPVATTLE
jgi:probable F420-dependent oxidoreductase